MPARLTGIRRGHVFIPFHYGAWISPNQCPDPSAHAANELTITAWDPVSKQPMFKMAAVRLVRLGGGDGSPSTAPTTTASGPFTATNVASTSGGDTALCESVIPDSRSDGGQT